jgi:hypothetical protein
LVFDFYIFDDQSFVIIDPKYAFKLLNNKKKWVENLKKFVTFFNKKHNQTEWQLSMLKKYVHQGAKDKVNCEILVIMYVDIVFSEKIIDQNPLKNRLKYQHQILRKSLPVFFDCLICGIDTTGAEAVSCDFCLRWICAPCGLPLTIATLISNPFECFLCRGNEHKPTKYAENK